MDEFLDAHLSGLSYADSAVVKRTIQNLDRWKTADEAFVRTYVMALVRDSERLNAVETLIDQMPTQI